MKPKTKASSENKEQSSKVLEDMRELERELYLLQDQKRLENTGVFRQQMLILLERIAVALETPESQLTASTPQEGEDE